MFQTSFVQVFIKNPEDKFIFSKVEVVVMGIY